jgi:putative intracellular protease/amidase
MECSGFQRAGIWHVPGWVEVVGVGREPVESMGGLTVQPTRMLTDLDPEDIAVSILPGGDRWEGRTIEPELGQALAAVDAAGVPIAAICAATTAIARAGLLRGRRHTSNGLGYLQAKVPDYAEAAN